MEAAIQTVVKIFLKSTKGKESLGKKEFQSLVKSQLSNILSDTDSKEAVNNMGQGLDADQDGKVGFEEYMKLVGYLAVSLSEQRNLAKEEPAQNATTAPEAQSEPGKEGEAEAKEEAGGEATTDAKAEAPAADGNVEAKAEAETQPEAPAAAVVAAVEVEAEKPAAAEVAAEAPAAAEVVTESLEVTVTEEVVVEESTEKEATPAAEEEGEKKTEEAAS